MSNKLNEEKVLELVRAGKVNAWLLVATEEDGETKISVLDLKPEVVPPPAREPRRWPVGSREPREAGLRVQSETNHVIFRYSESWQIWTAEQSSGGDGNMYHWYSLNGENASEGGMDLVEVLP